MKIALVFIILLSGVVVFAQPGPDTLWTRFYGWTGDDTAFCIKQTPDLGFIIAGTATIPGPTPHTDMFLMKTDSLGAMQGWHTYGGVRDQGAYGVALALDGGYALVGYTKTADGYLRPYYVRVNAAGDTLCSDISGCLGAPCNGWFASAVQMWDSSFMIVRDENDISSGYRWLGHYRSGFTDCFTDGGSWPSTHDAITHSVRRTTDSATIWVGQCVDSAGASHKAFLQKDSRYPLDFATYGGNGYDDYGYDVAVRSSGFFVAGASWNGHNDGIFICKTDPGLQPYWVERFFANGDMDQWAKAILPAWGGGYVIAGTFVTALGDMDMLLAKISENGDLVWQRTYGTPGDEQAYSVAQTPDGGFVLVGYSTAHVGVMAEWYIVKTLPDPELSSAQPVTVTPQQYGLSAFPNPFNPTTTLSFTLAKAGRIRIVVYDITGREVRTLSDQVFEAGEHRIAFDGSALPSGIYFARLQSGEFIATRKLLLLK